MRCGWSFREEVDAVSHIDGFEAFQSLLTLLHKWWKCDCSRCGVKEEVGQCGLPEFCVVGYDRVYNVGGFAGVGNFVWPASHGFAAARDAAATARSGHVPCALADFRQRVRSRRGSARGGLQPGAAAVAFRQGHLVLFEEVELFR